VCTPRLLVAPRHIWFREGVSDHPSASWRPRQFASPCQPLQSEKASQLLQLACASARAQCTATVHWRRSRQAWLAVSPPLRLPLERCRPCSAAWEKHTRQGGSTSRAVAALRWEQGAFTALAVGRAQQRAARSRRSWIHSQLSLASSPSARMRHQPLHQAALLLHHSWPLSLQSRSYQLSASRSDHPIDAHFAEATSAAATGEVACADALATIAAGPRFAIASRLAAAAARH
jgi:hypothetical protein